jgi:hypothetical protein
MRRRLARRLGVDATRDAVSEARHRAYSEDPAAYQRAAFADAGLEGLFVDDGWPRTPSRAMAAEAGLPVYRVARIENWIDDARDACASFDELEERFSEQALAALGDNLIAFKSTIAYTVGLDVRHWTLSEARDGFDRWKAAGWEESRDHSKPVRDSLLWRTLAIAREHDRPVHIHSGAGDSSVQLEHARPKDLHPLVTECTDQAIVLIHSGWPWVEEGAYLAGVLPNVYLDTSVTTPWYALAIDQKLEAMLSLASPAKVMYGSDHMDPDALWLSAVLAREALGRVLATGVEKDWFDPSDAQAIAAGVLSGNVLRLHGIESRAAVAG